MLPEFSNTSIDILVAKCQRWFKEQGIAGELFFPDSESICPKPKGEAPLQVIFFGGFLKRFLQSKDWLGQNYQFWVLSSAVAEIFSQQLKIPREKIGIIPRYQLFPIAKTLRTFPDFREPCTFVFGGRLSPTKNIELLLRMVFFLQTEHRLPVQLELIGDFDNQMHEDRYCPAEAAFVDHRLRILGLLESLPWKMTPRIHPKAEASFWFERSIPNPLFVNFSTFICEDFGVSLAQVQQQGWPCLLSAWGAHHDVTGENVKAFPSYLIGHSHEPSPLLEIKARQLAHRFVGAFMQKIPSRSVNYNSPAPIRQDELEAMRVSFLERTEYLADRLREGTIDSFASTLPGHAFFSVYRALFAGEQKAPEYMFVVNDLHETTDPLMSHVLPLSQIFLSEILKKQAAAHFISLREVFYGETIYNLNNTKLVVVPFSSERLLPFLSTLISLLPQKAALLIFFTHEEANAQWIKKLTTLLRPQDRLVELSRHSLEKQVRGLISAHAYDF